MKHAQLLDCTLRDGAYIIDKTFGTDEIKGIISGLIAANMDIIEVGFLQDDGFGEGKPVYKNSLDAEPLLPQDRGKSLFTAFADFSRYSIKNLDDYTGRSFDAVRACFFKRERHDVLDFCREIKRKGYKLFVQPVDVLGYSDEEMLDLIHSINEIEPYCFSLVDTFGSVYEDDLHRVFSLVNHNLISSCKIGFHSHNNLQMSSSLSQSFLKMSFGLREVVVDATVSGMGRGAGNAPTELLAQYMVAKMGYHYDMDALLDLIDNYIEPLRARATWGYNIHLFLAGAYGAHVNNIAYLKEKGSIRSRDVRYILNKIGAEPRKRYDYDLLERAYVEYMTSDINDSEDFQRLKRDIAGSVILLIAPGHSAISEKENIQQFIQAHDAKVICINFVHPDISPDYIYINNVKRFSAGQAAIMASGARKIFTSNVVQRVSDYNYIISFCRLIKSGWEHMDNSTILLLRLLDQVGVAMVGIAGLDGYDRVDIEGNYAKKAMELHFSAEEAAAVNNEIEKMLEDFVATKSTDMNIQFVTGSRFEGVL